MKAQRVILMLSLLTCLAGAAWGQGPATPAAPTHGETTGEAQGVFSGYWGESFWTLIWFGVLLLVLWKFAWKPLLAGLHGREEHIERQISEAEKTRHEAKKVLDEYRAQLQDAERQGREIITQRAREAEKQAKEIQEAKQAEIERMKVRMETDIERERFEAEDSLWLQAGEIISRLGKEVFSKSFDDADNRRLIEEAIARLKETERSEQS